MRRIAMLSLAMLLAAGCAAPASAPTGVENRAELSAVTPTCVAEPPACFPRSLTLVDVAGRAYRPDDLAGQVVVLTFWASWASPSKAEIPTFVDAFARYAARGVAIFGILTADLSDADLRAFVVAHGITYPVLRLDSALAGVFGEPEVIPTTLVYDRTGRRRADHEGMFEAAELTGLLDQLLAE